MIQTLIYIANCLDKKGLVREAEIVDKVTTRIAQYGGPYSMDLPIGDGLDGSQHGVRVIPFKEMEEEFNDFEYGYSGDHIHGRKKFPRFYRREIELKGDDLTPGFTQGISQDAGNIWHEMNRNNIKSLLTRGKNNSIFDINSTGTGGITHMEYDIGPGMRGDSSNLYKDYGLDNLRNNRPEYTKYTPMH